MISSRHVVVKLRRGFDKGLALFDILLQLGQARFQKSLFLHGQLSNWVDLFNTVRLGGHHVSTVTVNQSFLHLHRVRH